MTYEESARNGQPLAAATHAVLTGSLWAIAIAWSTAIRSVVMELIPDDTRDVVLGELLAACITTTIAVGLSLVVSKQWCSSCTKREQGGDPVVQPRRTRAQARSV